MTAELKEYRIALTSNIGEAPVSDFCAVVADILRAEDFGRLTVLFASDGGDTDQSRALYNFIRLLPVPVHMHAIGHVGSASVPVFLAGNRRTCEPTARFFLHEYNWIFSGPQTLNRIDEAVQRLRGDTQFACEVIDASKNYINAATGQPRRQHDGSPAFYPIRPGGYQRS